MSNPRRKIGNNIRELRLARSMTQAELAESIGVDARTISSWEVNRSEPRMDAIEKMSAALHCQKSELLGYTYTNDPVRIAAEDYRFVETLHQLNDYQKRVVYNLMRVMIDESEDVQT